MTPLTDIIGKKFHITIDTSRCGPITGCLVDINNTNIWAKNIKAIKFTEIIKPDEEGKEPMGTQIKYRMQIETHEGKLHEAIYSHNDVCYMLEHGALQLGDCPDDVGTKGHGRHNYGKSPFEFL